MMRAAGGPLAPAAARGPDHGRGRATAAALQGRAPSSALFRPRPARLLSAGADSRPSFGASIEEPVFAADLAPPPRASARAAAGPLTYDARVAVGASVNDAVDACPDVRRPPDLVISFLVFEMRIKRYLFKSSPSSFFEVATSEATS